MCGVSPPAIVGCVLCTGTAALAAARHGDWAWAAGMMGFAFLVAWFEARDERP
jgi:hypothetical protein